MFEHKNPVDCLLGSDGVIEKYGGALRTLYALQTIDAHAVPGVDIVQAISLERITDNPSQAYTNFVRAWLGLVSESSLRRMEPREE